MRAIDSTVLDGELVIASGDSEGTIRLWRDGLRLLSSSQDGTARIWPVLVEDLLALARRRLRPLAPEQEAMLREYRDR